MISQGHHFLLVTGSIILEMALPKLRESAGKVSSRLIHLIHKWPPTWDERAAKHGIEAFWDTNLFSCKLWPINWSTYVELSVM